MADLLLLKSELRGEKQLYALAALTTAMATAALTLSLALGQTFERSFASASKSMLGGDLTIRMRLRDFSQEELQWLRDNSSAFSLIRESVAAAVVGEGDRSQMARVKVADNAYPLYGQVVLQDAGDAELRALLDAGPGPDGAYPAAVAPILLESLGIEKGDAFQAAGLSLRAEQVVETEPDPNPRTWMAAPLILVGEKAASGGHLSGPGLLSAHHGRVILPSDESEESWRARLDAEFPDSVWRVRNAEQSSSGLIRFVQQMRDFLAIMSLAAMFTAGIGVGGAAAAFIRARARAIAVIKMLGGGRDLIARVYLFIAAFFIISGAVAGSAAGAALLFQAAPFLSSSLPLPLLPEWPWKAFGQAVFSACAMGAAFVALPVLRAGRVNPLDLFKAGDSAPLPHERSDLLWAAVVWIVVLLAVPLGVREKIIAAAIISAAGVIYALSLACARAAGGLSRRIPPPMSWGLLAASRNRGQTAAGVVSLSVGMAMLVAILNIEGNFSARINDTLREEAPTFYLMGIRKGQDDELREALSEASPSARLRSIPFLRGKIESIGGRDASSIEAPSDVAWILRGDRGLTWTETGDYIGASEVTDGKLWDPDESRPQASFDEEAAASFGLQLGDELEMSVLGRRMTAIITSFREINWRSFDVNFVIILDREPFGSAPHSMMGAAFMPPEHEGAAKLAVIRGFPNVTPLAMSAVFDIARQLLKNISLLLQVAAAFMLAGAVPVVAASLMDGQRRRARDAVTLRLIGAPGSALAGSGFAEFAAMAAAALIPALVFGLLAGKFAIEHIFELPWSAGDGAPLLVALGGILLFAAFGIAGIVRAVRYPPLAVIRND